MVKSDSSIIDVSDYYAFGLEIGDPITPSPDNNYKYNGKEWNSELLLNSYDYGARFYDPVLGRWNVVDPLAENHHGVNPYNYALNNPMLYVDPMGLDTLDFNSLSRARAGDDINMGNGRFIKMAGDEVVVNGAANDNSDNGFLKDNWQDAGFLVNDLTQSFVNNSTTLKTSRGYSMPKTTVFIPGGLQTRASTRLLSGISKLGGAAAKAAPWVAGGTMVADITINKEVNVGHVYQATVTGLSLIPGAGLIVGGTALLAEGVSHYYTGQGVAENINTRLNKGVIYGWK